MSRKDPSFDQLVNYMSSEKADGNYDLHQNLFGRNNEDIIREFQTNSELLRKRKNGNYLYHEIISLQVHKGQNHAAIKDDLRDIAQRYIDTRSPLNMVYGCMHEDHDHNLHYHLLISANERGERSRLRLSQKQFDGVKRNLETHVLESYSHLKQQQLITAETTTEKMSVKAGEMKRRTGAMPRRDEVKNTLQEAMNQTNTMDNFIFYLSERGCQFYARGKNFGVDVQHNDGTSKKYRLSTLGIHEEFEQFQNYISSKRAEEAHAKQETKADQNQQATVDDDVDHTTELPSRNIEPQKHTDSDTASLEKDVMREKLKILRNTNQDAEDADNSDQENDN